MRIFFAAVGCEKHFVKRKSIFIKRGEKMAKEFTEILSSMLAEIDNSVDKREGSLIWSALAPKMCIRDRNRLRH